MSSERISNSCHLGGVQRLECRTTNTSNIITYLQDFHPFYPISNVFPGSTTFHHSTPSIPSRCFLQISHIVSRTPLLRTFHHLLPSGIVGHKCVQCHEGQDCRVPRIRKHHCPPNLLFYVSASWPLDVRGIHPKKKPFPAISFSKDPSAPGIPQGQYHFFHASL